MALNPDATLVRLLQQAMASRQAGDLASAVRLMEQAIRRAPDNAPLHHDLGQTLLEMRQPEPALRHFDRAVALAPAMGLAHFRRGVALELLGRGGFAAAYERAIATSPELAAAYGCLASAREQEGRRAEALALYRQAQARAAPGSTPACMYAARVALIEENLDAAEQALLEVLAQQPKLSSARGLLANILNARGRFAAAAEQLLAALDDNPRDVSLYYNLLQIKRLTAQDENLLLRMRAARALQVPTPARIRLHLALARGLDDTGDAAGAMAEITAAGDLRARHHPVDRAALRAQTDRMLALFTRAWLARRDHGVSDSDRPILVLGLPRSGTTLTEQILTCHSAIGGAGEVTFWDSQGASCLPQLHADEGARLGDLCAAYLAKLSAVAPTAPRVVDKNPFNYRMVLLAHLAFPQARIIHCRRHMADTALSIMMTALRAQPLFGAARDDLLFCCTEYLRLMAHVRAVLPPDRFFELHYESLVTAPEPRIRAMLEFLGLNFESACLAPEHNERIVRTASVWQARQPITPSSVGRWRPYAQWLADFAKLQ